MKQTLGPCESSYVHRVLRLEEALVADIRIEKKKDLMVRVYGQKVTSAPIGLWLKYTVKLVASPGIVIFP